MSQICFRFTLSVSVFTKLVPLFEDTGRPNRTHYFSFFYSILFSYQMNITYKKEKFVTSLSNHLFKKLFSSKVTSTPAMNDFPISAS